ncbi:unnamed protein product [Acanthoscelides obtectus]|uniref:Translin-associated protein X n=1 Tax=Acanthoscelides obtectus TaxID=200917 RepID=A0A9P0KRV3_ACAOB|nr:unnamed protein product [Acanthoscelides obtectus]CAK1681365.1 Translin-associated protein X [Acanthoscelides obtectus]
MMFKEYAAQLDDKHDKYERIVKHSRDITIESKRIIFLLHNSNTDIESKRESILEEADTRLKAVIDINLRAVAEELRDEDSYQFLRAYTNGLQEFIEALTFYQFIKNDSIDNWEKINNLLKYQDEYGSEFTLVFPQYEYILGIADFTGELMRRCINTLGVGNIEDCFKLCNFVRHINTGVLGLMSHGSKELSRKAYVLRQSLEKMELVCYNIQIRGTEIPKHMLLNVIESSHVKDDVDEGFY